MERKTSSTYRPGIDGLRAVAVLVVVFFHLNNNLFSGGFIGVDVFFVISGYLISRILLTDFYEGTFSLTHFYLRRIRRIIPALYALLLAATVAAVIILLPNDLKDFGRSLISQSAFSSNIYFYFKSDYFDSPALVKPLLHTWSLSVEEQFYILYPYFLFLTLKYLGNYVKYILLLLFFVALFATCYMLRSDHSAAFYFLPFRIWELLLGALLNFSFFPKLAIFKNVIFKQATGFTGVALILYGVFYFSANTDVPGLLILVPATGACLLILIEQGSKPTYVTQLLSTPLFVYTGKISYSLYLWHWPVIVFYNYIANSQPGSITCILLLALSFVLAVLSYRFIETPLRSPAFYKSRKYYIAFVLSGLLLFSVSGFLLDRFNGFPQRYPAKLQALIADAHSSDSCFTKLLVKNGSLQKHNPCKPGSQKDTSRINLLVWGDSHSGMLNPVLQKLAGKYKVAYAIYDCPGALNVYIANWDASYVKSRCFTSNKQILQYIRDNNITAVLFASAWSGYTEGRELKMEGAGQKDKLYADSATTTYSTTDSKRVFETRFTATVYQLHTMNIPVWIMKQVPQHRFWAPNEIARRIIYKQDTTYIGRPLSEHIKRQKFVNRIFEKLSASGSAHLLDPTPFFLSGNNFLSVYKEGKSLYYDYNHLSPAGTYRLENMFTPLFQSLIKH